MSKIELTQAEMFEQQYKAGFRQLTEEELAKLRNNNSLAQSNENTEMKAYIARQKVIELHKEASLLENYVTNRVTNYNSLSCTKGGTHIMAILRNVMVKIVAFLKDHYSKGLIGLHIHSEGKRGFSLRIGKLEMNVLFRRIIKYTKKTHKAHTRKKRGENNA